MDNKKRGVYGLAALVVFGAFTIFASRPIYEVIDNGGVAKKASSNKIDSSVSGTYTGTAQGFGGEVVATVVIKDGMIDSVELVGKDETQGVGTPALEQLPAVIKEKQSTDVDTIAGATITSEAVLKAVDEALASVQDGSVSDSYTVGTYTGSANGFGGDVTATVVINESGAIESIELVGDLETQGIGTPALEQLPEVIKASQSIDVDVIAGATITSNAVFDAVQTALDSAK